MKINHLTSYLNDSKQQLINMQFTVRTLNIAKQDMVFAKRHKKLRRLVRQWMKRINSLCRLTEVISRLANFLYYYSKPLKSM